MDRPEPGLIKWSPNPDRDSFLHVNLQHRVAQIYEPTGHAQTGRFEFQKLSRHDDLPPLTTYDWSPSIPGLLAVGTNSGYVNLLRIDDNSNAFTELPLRISRPCHAVAFNKGNLLAVGLERVRNDQCLHIWDVSRVSNLDAHSPGFPADSSSMIEPIQRLEPSVAISSLKFFEDNPQTLAVGVKNQGIRVYDLRDPHGSVINYPTKLNNNLTVDYADPNYFASSSLDSPVVVIWDRRTTSRLSASPAYLDAVDNDGLPLGAALKIDNAVDVLPEHSADKYSLIRSLRFCRNRRGLLAVLSRTGQLKVIDTQRELITSDVEFEGSPELLQVRRSYELDLNYSNRDKKHDRIVSFDWVTLDSSALTPRALVLRANGAFDILEKPHYTTDHVYKLVPWQAPHRGLQGDGDYHTLMKFDQAHAAEMLGPVLIQQALSHMSLFGQDETEVESVMKKTLRSPTAYGDLVQDASATIHDLPDTFLKESTIAHKLEVLRNLLKETPDQKSGTGRPPAIQKGPQSSRQSHEKLLLSTLHTGSYSKKAQAVLDHVALLRADSQYLFDFTKNKDIVSDDTWLSDLWGWIAGAEQDASEEGMTALGLDLSYMGVRTIWANDLGDERLLEGATYPDRARWERSLQTINKNHGLPTFEGVKTGWPGHRQACIRVCGWGRSSQNPLSDLGKTPIPERDSSWYTMATAHAIFAGENEKAVQLLKKASHWWPELLFVSLALQLIARGDIGLDPDRLDFDDNVASHTDPYLRAISSYIATGDWEVIANQESLPLRERTYIALRYFDDDSLSKWLDIQVKQAIQTGDIEAIVLTGITDQLVDIFATYVEKFNDVQTATLVMSICAPRYIDDYRCVVWRNAYRAYLQRHKAFYQRTKFEVESTKRSKRDGVPTIKPSSRQIALRCVYCDAEYELSKSGGPSSATNQRNPLMATNINAGVSCPNCGRHLPRCVVCLEVVGVPRGDRPGADPDRRVAARFPTFCLKCEHVTHLEHARQWFAKHPECPVPECRCKCNFRANPDLSYR